MSDKTEEPASAEPPEMIQVTVHVPARVLADYDADVGRGVYADRDESLRHGLIESWRFHRGRYSTLRIDILGPEDRRPDTDEVDTSDALAAADALTTPETETGEPEGGDGEERPD